MFLNWFVLGKMSKKVIERNSYYFQIAGHYMQLSVSENIDIERLLPSFSDFRVVEVQESTDVFKIELMSRFNDIENQSNRLLNCRSDIWNGCRFEESSDKYITRLKGNKEDSEWIMSSSRDFKHSIIYFVEDELYISPVVSWLLMVTYSQAILFLKSILVHASVVLKDGRGYAFLGKSRVGKSTHSKLWIETLKDCSLLNDENPVVRIHEDGRVMVYGSPWSGKARSYHNQGVVLQGMACLRQGDQNIFTKLEGKASLVHVIPSINSLNWNMSIFNQMLDTLEYILGRIPIGLLCCLPNEDSAKLCYGELIEGS